MDSTALHETAVRIDACLDTMVKPHRASHSRATARLAAELCERFGIDPAQGLLSGMAHDMCRDLQPSRQFAMAEAFAIGHPIFAARESLQSLLQDERFRDKMLHGPAAAYALESDYGIRDAAILEAVAFHSIGDTHLGDLAKIVFIADKLEPGRARRPSDADSMLHTLSLEPLFRYTIACIHDWFSNQGMELSPFTRVLYARIVAS